jgi:carboxypeptidase Taq
MSLLLWDEQTKLPPAGNAYRAEQVAHLAGLVHKEETDPRLGPWLAELSDSPLAQDPHSDAGATIRLIRRDYEKKVRIPQDLIETIARASVEGHQAWIVARRENDFPQFLPHLENLVRLRREQAAALGAESAPYEALLDYFEPEAKPDQVARLLGELGRALAPLVQEIAASGKAPRREVAKREFPKEMQEKFGRRLSEKIGYRFDAGRIDETVHPFCSEIGPRDVRIGTRYEPFIGNSLSSILHEAGHAIYDQQLRADQYGLPPGRAVSLGIHESQSRMWENFVGRGRDFWQREYPDLLAAFPTALSDVSLDDFYFLINDVRPSLIRVDADEATYNLHIIARFELEQDLVAGSLAAADLPRAWNEKYETLLGITPPDDARGCLQDVHFSEGMFGYFPTYSLGNLYAAQFFAQADHDLGGLAASFRGGRYEPLREWLREKIHQHGQCYSAAELVERATGQPLSHEPLMRYLREKYAPLYGL